MGVCNCSMFCCTLLYVHFSIAIILMGKRELIALLNLSSWCLVMVERLFITVPLGCLQFVIVVFPDHTHLLFVYAKHIVMPCKVDPNKINQNNNFAHDKKGYVDFNRIITGLVTGRKRSQNLPVPAAFLIKLNDFPD